MGMVQLSGSYGRVDDLPSFVKQFFLFLFQVVML